MEILSILLTVFLIALSALYFYLGFIRRKDFFTYKAQAFFPLFMALTIVLVMMLKQQSGAVERLALTGIVPYPTIECAVGGFCGEGENPFWLFKADPATSESDVRNFYLDKANRPGWELTSSEDWSTLFLEKGDQNMMIGFSKGLNDLTIEYDMTRKANSPGNPAICNHL